jgi:hypothetical protein
MRYNTATNLTERWPASGAPFLGQVGGAHAQELGGRRCVYRISDHLRHPNIALVSLANML